jgi:hypothetical protein
MKEAVNSPNSASREIEEHPQAKERLLFTGINKLYRRSV